MTKVPFHRPLTEKTVKQAKLTILRGALVQMRRINPGNAETYETRLLYLKTEDSVAYRLFMLLADALNGAACVPPQHPREPETRQRARDWLDALDAYLDRKYPCAQTEPSAPAGVKGTNGAPTPPSAADAAASGRALAGSTGSGPGASSGKGRGGAEAETPHGSARIGVDRTRLKQARRAAELLRSMTAGTGYGSAVLTILDELEAHREALNRAGLLKP
jgi:hypothetical protein